jgi:hypothetical protein
LIDANSDNVAEKSADPRSPTSWEALGLHAWITVTILYGERRPARSRDRRPADSAGREAQIRSLLGLPNAGARIIVDILGNNLAIDDGIVQKMLGAEYLGRVPYLPWVPIAASRAVEIWRHVTVSKTTQDKAVRDYYLVPISDDPQYDGYVIIVENGRIFNLMLFRGSYADTTLRRNAAFVYKSYPDGLLCTSGCCASLAKQHRELGILRGENRRLELQLRDERKARKALEREIERFEPQLKEARRVVPAG